MRARYAHLSGPGYGNGNIADEDAAPGNARGGPAPRGPVVGQQENTRRPQGSTFAADGLSPNDQGWIRDRHMVVYQGNETTGRSSGLHDPIPDGPIRPSLRMLVRNWRRETGTDATRAYDPPRRGYLPIGWQDGSRTIIWGGTPGFVQPYGQRGSGEQVGSDTSGAAQLPSTVPHGLHTHTVNSRRSTLKTYRSTPQMVAGRQDRLSNSTRAGQSYSQTTLTQGARR